MSTNQNPATFHFLKEVKALECSRYGSPFINTNHALARLDGFLFREIFNKKVKTPEKKYMICLPVLNYLESNRSPKHHSSLKSLSDIKALPPNSAVFKKNEQIK